MGSFHPSQKALAYLVSGQLWPTVGLPAQSSRGKLLDKLPVQRCKLPCEARFQVQWRKKGLQMHQHAQCRTWLLHVDGASFRRLEAEMREGESVRVWLVL